jgi:hypothetical protein
VSQHIRSFGSIEEMFEAIEEGNRQASAALTDQQRGIMPGQHCIRFEPVDRLVIFGEIPTADEFRAGEVAAGADEAEADEAVHHFNAQVRRDLLFGQWYSVVEPRGEWGTAHRWSLWPLSGELFEAARRVEWDTDRLPDPEHEAIFRLYQEQFEARHL